jgi:small-conductance mechanosensitive channel
MKSALNLFEAKFEGSEKVVHAGIAHFLRLLKRSGILGPGLAEQLKVLEKQLAELQRREQNKSQAMAKYREWQLALSKKDSTASIMAKDKKRRDNLKTYTDDIKEQEAVVKRGTMEITDKVRTLKYELTQLAGKIGALRDNKEALRQVVEVTANLEKGQLSQSAVRGLYNQVDNATLRLITVFELLSQHVGIFGGQVKKICQTALENRESLMVPMEVQIRESKEALGRIIADAEKEARDDKVLRSANNELFLKIIEAMGEAPIRPKPRPLDLPSA